MSKREAEDDLDPGEAKKGKSSSISDPGSYLFVQIDADDDHSPTMFYIKHKEIEESDDQFITVADTLSSMLGEEFVCLDEGRIFKYEGSIEEGKKLLLSKGFVYDQDLKLSDNEEGGDSEEDSEEDSEDGEGEGEGDDSDEDGSGEEGEGDSDQDGEGDEDDDDDDAEG